MKLPALRARRVALLALFIAGCATPRADEVAVVWNRTSEVQATCAKLSGQPQIFKLRGCSKWSDTNSAGQRVCAIYAPAPTSERDTAAFATLGHELMHCFDGDWHDKWGRMNDAERQAATGAARKPEGGAAAN